LTVTETSDNIVHGKNNSKRRRQGNFAKDHEKSPRDKNREAQICQEEIAMTFQLWAEMRKRLKKRPASPLFKGSDLQPRTCELCAALFYVLPNDDRTICVRCVRGLLNNV
jgi:hypothetical protein